MEWQANHLSAAVLMPKCSVDLLARSCKDKLKTPTSRAILIAKMSDCFDVSIQAATNRLKAVSYTHLDVYKRQVIHSDSSKTGKPKLVDWLTAVEVMDSPEFDDCTKAYRNWFQEILNSMDVPWSNGFIEGCNNKTKVLKRVCFGMRNFSNFRKRILFCHT